MTPSQSCIINLTAVESSSDGFSMPAASSRIWWNTRSTFPASGTVAALAVLFDWIIAVESAGRRSSARVARTSTS